MTKGEALKHTSQILSRKMLDNPALEPVLEPIRQRIAAEKQRKNRPASKPMSAKEEGKSDKPKILFVGGNPKGWDEPFDLRTHSGQVLRGIVNELGIDAHYLDLWDNPEMEEKYPKVTKAKYREIYEEVEDGYLAVPLGRKVKRAIMECDAWFSPFPITVFIKTFLPHPASRRAADIKALKDGLASISTAKSTPKESAT